MRFFGQPIALAAAACGLILAISAQAAQMRVQVRETQVRNTPDFLGKLAGTLAYGDAVETVQTQGAWVKVNTAKGISGWVNASALTAKKIELTSAGRSDRLGASADEVATAGKGFTKEVEDQYKARNRNVSFAWVDSMEKIRVSPAEASGFLAEGQVSAGGGAR